MNLSVQKVLGTVINQAKRKGLHMSALCTPKFVYLPNNQRPMARLQTHTDC